MAAGCGSPLAPTRADIVGTADYVLYFPGVHSVCDAGPGPFFPTAV